MLVYFLYLKCTLCMLIVHDVLINESRNSKIILKWVYIICTECTCSLCARSHVLAIAIIYKLLRYC